MVGFVNDFNRDLAVGVGRIDFGEFEGRFYDWSENLGVEKIYRPMIVWISMVGLPLQCLGRVEIKQIVDSFGKLLKLSRNVYDKSVVDVARAMVEVEDLALIPKVIKVSYKAISDNVFRKFVVQLQPSSHCLPVSQITDANYKLNKAEEDNNAEVVQGWSSVESKGKGKEAGVAGDVRRKEEDEAAEGDAGESKVADSFVPAGLEEAKEGELSVEQEVRGAQSEAGSMGCEGLPI